MSRGVRARTTIRSPSSTTFSMTSGDNPENTTCTSLITSSTWEATTATTLGHHRKCDRVTTQSLDRAGATGA